MGARERKSEYHYGPPHLSQVQMGGHHVVGAPLRRQWRPFENCGKVLAALRPEAHASRSGQKRTALCIPPRKLRALQLIPHGNDLASNACAITRAAEVPRLRKTPSPRHLPSRARSERRVLQVAEIFSAKLLLPADRRIR